MQAALWILIGYLVIGLQAGLGDVAHHVGVMPNFILVLVVHLALNVSPSGALTGALLLGLGHDMVSASPIGLFAFAYGLAAMGVLSTHRLPHRENIFANFAVALEGALIVATIIFLHEYIHPPSPPTSHMGEAVPAVQASAGSLLLGALLTGLLGAPMLWGIQRMLRAMGVTGRSRRR